MGGPSRRDPRAPPPFLGRLLLTLLLGAIAACAFALVLRAGTVLLLIFAGILFALFLSGIAGTLKRRVPALPYGAWLALAVLAVLGVGALTLLLLGPRLLDQISALATRLPRTVGAIVGDNRLRAFLARLNRLRAASFMKDMEVVVTTASGLLKNVLELVGGGVVFLFLGIYGAAQPSTYERALLRLVPIPARPRAAEVLGATARSLRRWLYGRVVAMAFVGVGTGCAFWALGVPAPLALALLAGLLTFIEYIGAILSAVPAILLALDSGFATAAWVAVLFTAVHTIEGYLLTPLLARRSVRFPPAFTLGVQLILGVFFGLAGLMLATPVAVVLVSLVQMLYVEDRLGDRDSEPPSPYKR